MKFLNCLLFLVLFLSFPVKAQEWYMINLEEIESIEIYLRKSIQQKQTLLSQAQILQTQVETLKIQSTDLKNQTANLQTQLMDFREKNLQLSKLYNKLEEEKFNQINCLNQKINNYRDKNHKLTISVIILSSILIVLMLIITIYILLKIKKIF